MGTKNRKTSLFNMEAGLGEDFGVETIEKAKVGILGWVNQRPSVLLLTRSEHEDTRAGQHDLPGGKLEPGEAPIDAQMRETGLEELPGVIFRHVTELKTRDKTKEEGIRVISHMAVALAEFPASGIELSREHSRGDWWPLDELGSSTLPDKYQARLASRTGLIVVEGLMYIARHEAMQLDGPVQLQEPAPPHLELAA